MIIAISWKLNDPPKMVHRSTELAESGMEEIRQMDTGKGSHNPEADGVAEMLLGAFDVHTEK